MTTDRTPKTEICFVCKKEIIFGEKKIYSHEEQEYAHLRCLGLREVKDEG